MNRALWLFVLCACGGPRECAKSSDRPSILVIVLDSMRADALSIYGNSHPNPQIELLAEAGVVFEDTTSPGSWTWPGHAALFTGLPPWESGARHNSDPDARGSDDPIDTVLPMRTDRPTFAETLGEAGYRTVALTANGWLHADLGLTRGFTRVDRFHRDVEVTRTAESVLSEDSEQPLLLFLNYMEAHAPYSLTPVPWARSRQADLMGENRAEWLEPYLMSERPGLDLYQVPEGAEHSGFQAYMRGELDIPAEGLSLLRDLYDSALGPLDSYHLTRIISAWTTRYPDGVVVLTSDHGEYLGEHGLLEHGLTVFPEVLEIPLVIAAPGRIEAGLRISTPVQLQDVAGTIVELAGLENTTQSLIPIIDGEERPGAIQAAAWHHATPAAEMGGRFEHDWFYWREDHLVSIRNSAGESWLYDRQEDPRMLNDLSEIEAEAHSAISERSADGWPLHTSDEEITAPEDVVEALRALGYQH